MGFASISITNQNLKVCLKTLFQWTHTKKVDNFRDDNNKKIKNKK